MNKHYHVSIGDELGRVTGYLRFDNSDEGIVKFLYLSKELVATDLPKFESALETMRDAVETKEDFFIASEGDFFMVGFSDCEDGLCNAAFLN